MRDQGKKFASIHMGLVIKLWQPFRQLMYSPNNQMLTKILTISNHLSRSTVKKKSKCHLPILRIVPKVSYFTRDKINLLYYLKSR